MYALVMVRSIRKKDNVLVELASLQTEMILTPKLIVEINSSHKHIVEHDRLQAWY